MEDKGRLINAYDAVIKISGKVTPILQKHGSKPRGIYLAVLEALAECPTVDAVEVVHSQWDTVFYERNGTLASYSHICPKCKYFYRDVRFNGHNYCPNCGAKMDGITDKC